MYLNPLVGDGVTYTIGSDWYPATVIARKARVCTIRFDTAVPCKGALQTDTGQRWLITQNPKGATRDFTLRADGRWLQKRMGCGELSAGRAAHRDPSF